MSGNTKWNKTKESKDPDIEKELEDQLSQDTQDYEIKTETRETGSKTYKEALKEEIEDEDSKEHIVTIKVVETVKGRPRVLPGARRTLAPYFSKTGELVTGVSKADAKRLGDLLGIELDRKFWESFMVVLTDKITHLNLKDPWSELRYMFLKEHFEVANSTAEITNDSAFVIFNELEEAKKENKKFEKVLDAYSYIKNMTLVERSEFLSLFGVRTASITDEVILKKLREKADEDTELFITLYTDKNRSIRILLRKLVQYEIVRRNGVSYFYGTEPLGGNEELAIMNLKDPKNQELLITLKQMLREKERN